MNQPAYYSLRQMSPYRGTVQVVERGGFRAFSEDGHHWHVQYQPAGGGRSVYGAWSVDRPDRLIDTPQTGAFLDALRNHPPVPFAPADSLELWLLDKHEHLPLALLATALPNRTPPRLDEVSWQSAIAAKPFVADSLLNETGEMPGYAHAEVLRRTIQLEAGAMPRAQWFFRDEAGDGCGDTGCRIDEELRGRSLARSYFPELLLREHGWDDDAAVRLIQDYHEWLAPRLLTHDALVEPTRAWLEKAARRQAALVYYLRKVMPDVADNEQFRVMLVQGRLEAGL
ncbi:MAG: hypothetical protein OEZ10_10885 [Gammaproteobacteria bacterium]|nr:hypothetical protein [Gammaproteobacteria bacterium]